MTPLVLLHGRDLDGVDPDGLETRWLGALNAGLAAAGSGLRLGDDDASFVSYADALAHLTEGRPGQPPPVTVHASGLRLDPRALDGLADDELRFVLAVVREVLAGAGYADAVAEGLGDTLAAAVAAALAALDRLVPGLSAAVLLLAVRDVYAYLHDGAVRDAVDAQVAAALPARGDAVVVAHSLGSVVAVSVLAGRASGAQVPLLATLGSPLGIRAVREALRARDLLEFPPGVRRWVNARDPRDVLALHDLAPDAVGLPAGSTGIESLHVDNRAPGHHAAAVRRDDGGWAGYLADPAVAATVGGALDAGDVA